MPLARHEDIDAVGRFLFERGIYVTLAAYPLVPRDEVGFRIQVTAANTDAEIEQLVDVLGELAGSFELQPARREGEGGVSVRCGAGAATRWVVVPRRSTASLDRRSTCSCRRSRATGR